MGKMNFSLSAIDQRIAKLNKRLEELHTLMSREIPWDDQEVKSTSGNIVRTIKEVFGENSDEYKENWGFSLIPILSPYEDLEEYQKGYHENLSKADILLKKLREWLEEKKEFLELDPTEKIQATFDSLDLHPRIASTCERLFYGNHYREAVLNASIALINMVKEKSNEHHISSETSLMEKVFSAKNPILSFNELKNKSDQDEQEGFMYLFKGATLGIRNPRSHALNPDDQQEALEFITFLSLLAKLVDKAKLQLHDWILQNKSTDDPWYGYCAV